MHFFSTTTLLTTLNLDQIDIRKLKYILIKMNLCCIVYQKSILFLYFTMLKIKKNQNSLNQTNNQ